VYRFQRVLRRDEPPDFVELDAAQRLAADMEMALMGRIERAAEQPDAPPAPIAERARQIEDGSVQERTWPSPRTTYL
jgi:hypothetical protein